MADRTEDRRLDGVAHAEPLRGESLLLELLAIEADREERGERREEAAYHRRVRVDVGGQDEPAHPAVAGRVRKPCAHVIAELDPCVSYAQDSGNAGADPVELRRQVLPLKERDRELAEESLFSFPLLGIGGTPP